MASRPRGSYARTRTTPTDDDRRIDLAVEYVNLKECRTLFGAANELFVALCGEQVGAYEGLDGAFEAI